MFKRNFLTFFSLCLVFVQAVFAQIVIHGTVTDNGAKYLGNGAEPVPNAFVRLIYQPNPIVFFSAYTDEQGQYSIQISATDVENNSLQKPNGFRLLQNYPNPFNPSTVINYELAHPSHVKIDVFNVLGQHVKTLVDAFEYGSGRVVWNGTDDHNRGVAAGLYIYSMKAGDVRINKKMLLIDGQTGSAATTANHSAPAMNDPSFFKKQTSNKFILDITGDNIETYQIDNISIGGDSCIDVSVTRTVTDIDGNVYRMVKIGDQWWMAENLMVTHYRDGTPIPHVTDNGDWAGITNGAYCAYNNDENNMETYGLLYNWYAVSDSCNIAPEGLHIPTDEEWKKLEVFLGMDESETNNISTYRGTNEGSKLAGNAELWSYGDLKKNPAFGESGFFALPGGYRRDHGGIFGLIGGSANFWTSSRVMEIANTEVWRRIITCDISSIYRDNYTMFAGLSVRCIMDLEPIISLDHITIEPKNETVYSNEMIQYSCRAFYLDGSKQDVTIYTDWSIEPDNYGRFSFNGMFYPNYVDGTGTITASYGGKSDQTSVTIPGGDPEKTGTVTDIDGNVYKTIKIGDQWWMAENLKVTHYRDGTSIPHVTDNNEWAGLTTGAYCAYDNNESNVDTYGYLYNWYAVGDNRNIAPNGWHVPTDEEWQTLVVYLGGYSVAGGKLKEAGTEHWNSPNTGATNESGFCALPGGYREWSNGILKGMGAVAYFWLSKENNYSPAWSVNNMYPEVVYRYDYNKKYGYSVRCVKD